MTANTGEVYTCPMDPDVMRYGPGNCPKCGMDLVPLHKQASSPHANMEESFKKRFLLSLPFVLLVVVLSEQIQEWFGFTINFPGINLVQFLLASVIVFGFGFPFYQMAWGEIKSRSYGMMTLVSLAVLSGYFFSAAAIFIFNGEKTNT